MTSTVLITLNAVLAATVFSAVMGLLAYGIHSDRRRSGELVPLAHEPTRHRGTTGSLTRPARIYTM